MIKLTAKNYRNVIQRQRIEWPKYMTQLLNIATQNSQAFRPKYIGPVVETFRQMRESSIPGTLKNWEKYYKKHIGEKKLIEAGRKIHAMCLKMGIQWIGEDMCIEYAKETAYNKTHMGYGGQEMAVEVAAKYFGLSVRWPTPEEDSQEGIDAWIGEFPVQVKPHDSVSKAHIYNHANTQTHLVITYENKKQVCYIHNPEFVQQKERKK